MSMSMETSSGAGAAQSHLSPLLAADLDTSKISFSDVRTLNNGGKPYM